MQRRGEYIAVHILQRIYGSEERGGYIAEDTLQRIYCSAERGEGVEQDLCKALALGSHQLVQILSPCLV